jgi:hypothetical protein
MGHSPFSGKGFVWMIAYVRRLRKPLGGMERWGVRIIKDVSFAENQPPRGLPSI